MPPISTIDKSAQGVSEWINPGITGSNTASLTTSPMNAGGYNTNGFEDASRRTPGGSIIKVDYSYKMLKKLEAMRKELYGSTKTEDDLQQ
jgi:hypothetical protein